MSGLIGAKNQFASDFNNPDTKLQGTIVSKYTLFSSRVVVTPRDLPYTVRGLTNVPGIYDIGCAAGSLYSFVAGERHGRKVMILAGGSTMIVGTIILASSTTLAQLLVGRIITGIGNGFNSSNIPAYQSELCRAKNRGMLLSMQGVVTIVGLCIAYWLDYGLSFASGPIQWRFPIAFQAFFAICLVFQMLWLPETPRYLCLKDKTTEASQVVAALQGKGTPIDDPEVQYIIKQINTGIQIESEGGPFKYKELLQGGRTQNFRRIVLCCAVNVMQQFTGSNMINYYAPVVYANAMHLSRNLSLILGGCTSLTYLVGSCIPLWAMDHFGRRALLMFSATGLTTCFAIAAGLLSTSSTSAAYGATAMVFLFQIFLGIGFLPIPWFYPAEVTTTRIRSKGQSLASFINWMCVFTVVQVRPLPAPN